ncbi:MAG: DALR anticodon-binding domain-containing protein, partial [Atribacterota bacterium]
LMAKQYYDEIYACLETLNEVIDVFFDEVLVMVDDENLRNNRLALLKNIADLYFTVADLSKIALAKGTIRGD